MFVLLVLPAPETHLWFQIAAMRGRPGGVPAAAPPGKWRGGTSGYSELLPFLGICIHIRESPKFQASHSARLSTAQCFQVRFFLESTGNVNTFKANWLWPMKLAVPGTLQVIFTWADTFREFRAWEQSVAVLWILLKGWLVFFFQLICPSFCGPDPRITMLKGLLRPPAAWS